jgi:hypothetical protein
MSAPQLPVEPIQPVEAAEGIDPGPPALPSFVYRSEAFAEDLDELALPVGRVREPESTERD